MVSLFLTLGFVCSFFLVALDGRVGCLFEIPSGLDGAEARVFKVLKMETIAIYPADITCELGPMFKDELHNTEIKDFSKTNFNLVIEEEDEF